jgi:hypothetical protein
MSKLIEKIVADGVLGGALAPSAVARLPPPPPLQDVRP